MTETASGGAAGGGARRFWAAHALLPGALAAGVTLTVVDGLFTGVQPGTRPAGATVLPGVVLPGFANAHSHAFHRALRGRTHDGCGTFWTWRDRMYAIAGRLDPDTYLALARATYAEMALAGVTAVAEFHYLHHAPSGRPYAEPNVMGHALRHAAADAGVRLTLLDSCYLTGGFDDRPLDVVQRRFADRDVDAWAQRAPTGPGTGVAIHSVRAVPWPALGTVAEVAAGRPLHAHLSEQPAENAACLAQHGVTPTELLGMEGVLSPTMTAVHATHLTGDDIRLLGGSGAGVCFCPTTERDLADGIGPARALHDAGAPLSLGSDQHAVTDLMEEARALEMHERLTTGERGRFTQTELLAALTRHTALAHPPRHPAGPSRQVTPDLPGPPGHPEAPGHPDGPGHPDAPGHPDGPGQHDGPPRPVSGRIAPGAPADLVAVRTDTVRTAGCDPAQILSAATAADVDTVLVDGTAVVSDGHHRLGDVGALLRAAITPLWAET